MGNDKFVEFCAEIESDIQNAYITSPALDEAEKLAAKFLHAMIVIGDTLRDADLDARMKKTGLKAIKAAVYIQECSKGEKKPTEATLSALIDSSREVTHAQEAFDRAEVYKNELENYLSVAREAHVYFRGVAKGRFE